MKSKYLENINVCYMYTDSFIYDVKTNDMYDDFRNDIPTHFDTSAYTKENVYNFPLMNKKVLCLRAKMYSVKINRVDKEIKKIKGVRNSVTARLSINDI